MHSKVRDKHSVVWVKARNDGALLVPVSNQVEVVLWVASLDGRKVLRQFKIPRSSSRPLTDRENILLILVAFARDHGKGRSNRWQLLHAL